MHIILDKHGFKACFPNGFCRIIFPSGTSFIKYFRVRNDQINLYPGMNQQILEILSPNKVICIDKCNPLTSNMRQPNIPGGTYASVRFMKNTYTGIPVRILITNRS